MRLVPVFPAVGLCACAALAAAPHRMNWNLGEFTWVRLATREKGAEPSSHPAVLDVAALASGLGEIQCGGEALFEAKELQGLVKPIQEALAGAGADEDLLLLSTNRRGHGFLSAAFGVTARIFVEGGKVNVIVHDARLDFVDRYRAMDSKPTFTYGSRTQAGGAVLSGKGLTSRRADWVQFAAVPFVASVAAPAAESAKAPVAEPAKAPVAEAGKAPAPETAPAGTSEQRLRNLKRLREENLISEEEYQQKRKAILDTL